MNEDFELDRPPAGTPCTVCQSLGHFCAADRYVGATERGICKDCAASQSCPVMKARDEKEEEQMDIFTVPAVPKRKRCWTAGCNNEPEEGRHYCSAHIAPRRPPAEHFEDTETQAASQRVTCLADGCTNEAASTGPYCSKKHGWKNAQLNKPASKPGRKPGRPANVAAPRPAAPAPIELQAPAISVPESAAPKNVTVTITLSEQQLDKLWEKLSSDQKVVAIGVALQASLGV